MNRLLFALLFIRCIGGTSQELKLPQNIQSPNAASLGKYGDIPTSLYTGTTNVNIPLYSMEEGGVKMDISLDYDTSGVRVNSLPGWVGQNWSLNAGGVITRSIEGFHDEYYISPSGTPGGLGAYGYFYPQSHTRLNDSNWMTANSLKNTAVTNSPNGGDNMSKDSQPDIFTFNFMGHHGKFLLGEDGSWKVLSDSNLKIIIDESTFIYPFNQQFIGVTNLRQSKTIARITIIDDKGIIYTFGSDRFTTNAIAVEYSKDFLYQREMPWRANAWYLTEVRSPENIQLYKLQYERDSYTAQFFPYSTYKTFNAYFHLSGMMPDLNCLHSTSSSNKLGGELISPVYLKKITSLTEKTLLFNRADCNNIFYNRSTGMVYSEITNFANNVVIPQNANFSQWLTELIPYDNINTPYPNLVSQAIDKLQWKRLISISGDINVSFETNNQNYQGEHQQRLNLKKVIIGYSTSDKVYQFEYDRFDQLPPLPSKAEDHLGYFRGTEYITPVNYSTHFNQRTTYSDKVKVGSLKKIIYPTKGFTEFIYEPHTYSQYLNDDKTALISSSGVIGGLRIKQIKTNDGNGNIEIKDYKYIQNYSSTNTNGNSSGILENLPKYYWQDWRIKTYPGQSITGERSETVFSTNSIIPLSNLFGSHIGYSEVAEVKGDGSYTIHKFTSNAESNYRNDPNLTAINVAASPYNKLSDKSLLRGKLKEKIVYDASGNWVHKTINYYTVNDPQLIKYAKGATVETTTCDGGTAGYGFILGNAYKIFYFDNNLVKEESYTNLDGLTYRTTNSYDYKYYPTLNSFGDCFLTKSKTITYLDDELTSGNEIKESAISYPFDNVSAMNSSLVDKRIFSPLLKKDYVNNELIATTEVTYKNFGSTSAPRLLPEKIFKSKGSSILEEDVIIDSYDSFGNITKYHKKNGMYTILVWCYKSRYPIIKIEGSDTSPGYAEMKASSIQSLLNSSSNAWETNHPSILNHLGDVRNNYPNHLVTTYTYAPFADAVKSITDPKGYTTFYQYDPNKRLNIIRDADNNIESLYNYNYRP